MNVDEKLLSEAELKRYRDLKWAADNGHIRTLTTAQSLRGQTSTYLGLVVWVVATVGCFAGLLTASSSDDTDSKNAIGIWIILFVLVMFGSIAAIILRSIQVSKETLHLLVDEYLTSIKYQKRTRRPSTSRGDSPSYYTNGHDPARWFGQYDTQDRNTMRATGMSADDYDSNVLEHDKD